MSGTCRKCGTHLDSPWKFCPLCGAENAQAAGSIAQAHPEHEKAPVKGGFSGLVLGLITAPVLIIPGVLMCLMVGPWMVIGIPFIVAGICAPFAGPLIGISAVRGSCPWCGVKISSVGPMSAFHCYACSKRIVVRKHQMVRAE
jgi:predicted RNA-binding Zn-ribbon protein involved in translation (DUF1610 family)